MTYVSTRGSIALPESDEAGLELFQYDGNLKSVI